MKGRQGALLLIAGFLLFESALVFVTTSSNRSTSDPLRVLAYGSFAASWGPGPELAEAFRKVCSCEIEIVDGGDAGTLVERLKIEKGKVDVVLGLDSFQLSRLPPEFLWAELDSDLTRLGPLAVMDWSPLTFVYRDGEIDPPKSLTDLLKPQYRRQIALQDPRTSTPGLHFVAWIHSVFGENTRDYLKKLKPNVHSWSPSWSAAYGLFKKGQVSLVFTYLTSPIYHWENDGDSRYQPTPLQEVLPIQWELMGVPEDAPQKSQALAFLRFLATPESQKTLMTKNYMFPLSQNVIRGTAFERLWLSPPTPRLATDVKPLLQLWEEIVR